MDAGNVVVKLIADIKNLKAGFEVGVAQTKRYAKEAETGAGRAEQAFHKAGRNIQKSATRAAASIKNLNMGLSAAGAQQRAQQVEQAMARVAASARKATAASAGFGTAWTASVAQFSKQAGTALAGFGVSAAKSFGMAVAGASKFSVTALGHVKLFVSGAAKAVAWLPNQVAGVFGRLNSLLRRIFNFRNMVVAMGIGAAVREFARFEEQLAMVSTMLDEQTMHYLPQYGAALQDMAIRFGEGTATISKGLYDILSASIPPAQALDVLNASLKAARAGLTDTKTAADALTTILNAYGYSTEYAELVSDRLFAIVKRGKTTFGELAPAIGNVASNAALAGVKFEVLGAAISTITRAGVRTDQAVTAINALIMAFLKPVPKAIEMAKKFGIELNSMTLHNEGLLTVMEKLKTASADQMAVIAGQRRGFKALAVAMQQMEGIYFDYAHHLDSAGESQLQYEKMTETLMHRLNQLWQIVKRVAVEAVQPFADDMKRAADRILEHKDAVVAWVRDAMTRLRAGLIWASEVFKGFVTLMQENPRQGFEVLLESLIAVMKAAAKIAVDLAIRIGQGIWQGVKDAVFGSIDEGELQRRAMALYRATGGKVRTERTQVGVGFGGAPVYRERTIPEDVRSHQAATEVVRETMSRERINQLTEPLLAGFGEDLKAEFEKIGAKIREGRTKAIDVIERADEKYRAALEDRPTGPIGLPTPEQRGGTEEDWEKLEAIDKYLETVERETALLDLLLQHKDRQAAKQRIVNEFQEQGLYLTDEETDKIWEQVEALRQRELQRIVQQDIENLKFEIDLLGQSNDQREKAILLRRLELEAEERGLAPDDIREYREELSRVVDEYQRVQKAAELGQIAGQGLTDSLRGISDALIEGTSAWEKMRDVALAVIRRIQEALVFKPLEEGLTSWATNAFKGLSGRGAPEGAAGAEMAPAATAAATAVSTLGTAATAGATAVTGLGTAVPPAATAVTGLGAASTPAATAITAWAAAIAPATVAVTSLSAAMAAAAAAITAAAAQIQASAMASAIPVPAMAHGGLVPQYRQRGGLIQRRGAPVYAASGLFTPRGTDTVPAMLTPGELVVDAPTTKRLRSLLGAGGTSESPAAPTTVNFHVQAVDAASVLQLFQRHGREMASIVQGEQRHYNHPSRRNSR